MTYEQEAPFAVQVEFSEGCNLYCNFCGLQGIREQKAKNYRFMTARTANRIASQLAEAGWNARIEFAMHGEPTMNPKLVNLVRIFRHHLPRNQLMMTSNGGGIVKSPTALLTALFEAGLNVYALDAYEYVNLAPKIMEDVSQHNDFYFEVRYYPDDKDASPHKRWPHTAKVLIHVQDISVADEGNHSMLNNHCGAGSPPLAESMNARCAKPFREMSFRWDGRVAICCNDWRGVYKIGSIHDNSLTDLWLSERMNAARTMLYHGRRDLLSPCDICDAKSYRVGLLPDKKGLIELDEPTKDDKRIAREAASGDPYTTPVKREWEK